jgi:uncharacterized protein involved in response to NO
VLLAPHRLGFLLASVMLALVSLWWALVQADRSAALGLRYAVAPSLVHAAAMSFGFLPLFFAGFAFTAGPRWLQVPGPAAREVQPALLAQAAGWLLWLAGAHAGRGLAAFGAALAALGLGRVAVRFLGLVRASRMDDRLHARGVAAAFIVGCACEAGVAIAVALHADEVARRAVLTGLWGFVVPVFVTVADRMIPFFGAGVLPSFDERHPRAVLALTLSLCALQAAAPWIGGARAVLWLRAAAEAAGGLVLLALAIAWAVHRKPRDRLLRMLWLGFAWFAVAFVLQGAADAASAWAGHVVLPLAGLHALTMGCLGSLMLAMVSRVTAAHGGRPQVVDKLLWALFCLLQAAVLLRIAAAVAPARTQPLLTVAAWTWAALMGTWGMRHAAGYGQPPQYHGKAVRAPRRATAPTTSAPPSS